MEIYELKRVKAKRQDTSWWAIMLCPISLNKTFQWLSGIVYIVNSWERKVRWVGLMMILNVKVEAVCGVIVEAWYENVDACGALIQTQQTNPTSRINDFYIHKLKHIG